MYSDPGNVPDPEKYAADDPKLGRPQVTNTTRGKQKNNFGKDPLGVIRMKDTDKNEGSNRLSEFEKPEVTYLKNKEIFKKLPTKRLVFESNKDNSNLLDESQLKG